MLATHVGRMRLIALVEACSWMFMLLVSMPLRYLAGYEALGFWAGAIHGGLFTVLMLAIVLAMVFERLPLRIAGLVFVAAIVPMMPFFIDHVLRRYDPAFAGNAAESDGVRPRPGEVPAER